MGPWAGQLVFAKWSKIEALFSPRHSRDKVSLFCWNKERRQPCLRSRKMSQFSHRLSGRTVNVTDIIICNSAGSADQCLILVVTYLNFAATRDKNCKFITTIKSFLVCTNALSWYLNFYSSENSSFLKFEAELHFTVLDFLDCWTVEWTEYVVFKILDPSGFFIPNDY